MKILNTHDFTAVRYEDLAGKDFTEYGDDENKVREIIFDEYGMAKCVSEYGADGDVAKKTEYSWFYEGELDRVWEYDGAGRITKESLYLGKGRLCGYWENEYSDDGLVCRSTQYDADGSVEGSKDIEYDEDGNDVRTVSYGPDGSVKEKVVYGYGDGGEVVREIHYDGDGNVTAEYDWKDYNEH